MAALNFPNSPSLNDTHTENGVTFKWNGAAWDRLGDIGAQGSAGAAGAQGAAGATGPVAGSANQVVYKDGSNNPAGSTNFTFDGTNLTVSGNVSIGGTLTYEDITNIDSVGIITAQAGVKVPDNQKIFLGSGNDLQIYHDGSHSTIIDSGTGSLIPQASRFSVHSADDSEVMIDAVENSHVKLYHNGNEKLATTSSGVKVSGSFPDIIIHDTDTTNDNFRILHNSGGTQLQVDPNNVSSGSYLLAAIDGSEKLRIDSSGNLLLKTGEIDIQGGNKTVKTSAGFLQLGTSSSHHTAIITAGSERLRITSAGQMGLGTNDPNSYGSSVKLAVANTSGTCGLSIISATNGDGNLYYADGTSGDATYRGYIRYNHTLDQFRIGVAGAEKLRIDSSGRLLVGTTSSSGSHILEVNSGTDNEGIKVVSTDAGSYIRFADNSTTAQIRLGAVGNDFKIDVNSSERLRITSAGKSTFYGAVQTSGSSNAFLLAGASSTPTIGAGIHKPADDTLAFVTASTERLRITSSGQLAGLDPGGGAPQIINNANVNLGGRYIWNRILSSNHVSTTTSNQFRIAYYRSSGSGYTNCYYRGVNIKIHAGGNYDWGGHGFVTYVGELLVTFNSNNSGRTHVITNEGYSFLQNNSNNMRFVDTIWTYDSNYLYGTLRFNSNESGTGWKPYYNIEIIDTDGVVHSVTGV